MIKIINELGDVKIGRQGEVVYQRKHGEQIRRMASPKRAIPSQRQIDHRNLYRAALDWRKSLSRANRRYLEGYCIANWVVDSYGIPLPWHRFALRIYLEAVKFVIVSNRLSCTGKDPLYEYYNTGDTTSQSIYDTRWFAQTFTPSEAHTIKKVKLKLCRIGLPGIVTIGIRATDCEGHPTGSDLCIGTIDGNTLTPDVEGDWYWITLGDGYDLDAYIKWGIVARALTGEAGNQVNWRLDSTDPTYERGVSEYSLNGGDSWAAYTGNDFMFEEWGEAIVPPVAEKLLHVRHPALLTVVHKRGELTIRGYEKLSSLDEEYLTKQVGLDVIKGDEVEATTITGRQFKHRVA